ncbi:MAG: sulfurtransferase, partial [Candidatus Limnocylindrus sp.]
HIPGAKSVPWKRAANDDGTFKGVADLRAIYEGEKGLAAGDDVIAYCRIGERSSHTWFVLTYLLGFKNVRNYDCSESRRKLRGGRVRHMRARSLFGADGDWKSNGVAPI